MKPFCEICESNKQKYSLKLLSTKTSNVRTSFFYKDGLHEHDLSDIEEYFQCSNNHSFSRKVYKECWCGWTAAN